VPSRQIRLALAALLCAVVLAPAAGASPASDSEAVLKDYARDRDITSCRFAQSQLENARGQIAADADTYATGFRAEVNREVKRWKDGGCKRGRASAVKLRIVKIQPKGAAGKESVTIRNAGSKSVDLRRFVLRDAADHAIRFTKLKLAPGRSIRVVTGCRAGHKGSLRKGSSYYACRSKQFWDDAGDVVELVTPQGALLSQKTYGSA